MCVSLEVRQVHVYIIYGDCFNIVALRGFIWKGTVFLVLSVGIVFMLLLIVKGFILAG